MGEEQLVILHKELKAAEKPLEGRLEKLNKQVRFFSIFAWLCVALGVGVFCYGLTLPKSEIERFAQFGDFVGGIVSSIWALAGLIFIYVAFLGQRIQLLQQQQELLLNRYELKTQRVYQQMEFKLTLDEFRENRIVLSEQKKELEIQNSNFLVQVFENTFFNLINLHHEIVQNMVVESKRKKFSTISGRQCFEEIYEQLSRRYKDFFIRPQKQEEYDLVIECYHSIYTENEAILGHYFRNLYHIIKFVDSSAIKNKKQYTNFIRAQLSSSELNLLFYNGISMLGREKFKPLIENYNLLKNMSSNGFLDYLYNAYEMQHKSFYDKKAFSG